MNAKALWLLLLPLCCGLLSAAEKPNIVFILADDLGYGDVGCYNPQAKVPTPNLDSLARKGMLFADAHSPSTVCSPSRYSLLTGRNAFRTGFAGVFAGVGGPSLIEDSRLTLPAMLRDNGYTTACFGKWHIGMTFYDRDGKQLYEGTPGNPKKFDWRQALEKVQRTDFSRSIPDGPINRGFDHFFGTACCPTTDWLYAFVEGDRVPVPPTGIIDKSTLPGHVYSTDCREGMIAPGFDLEEVDMVFLRKSQEFIENHAKNTPKKPFFLFHTTQAVHLPSFPGSDFKGKTKAGPHGDFIFEFDHIVGELIKSLEDNGFGNNTLVMISSDNGPETIAVKDMRETYNHDGARPWRGVKRDQWEGGHRVPLIAYWPAKIKANSTTDQTVCLTDLMATCAAIVGCELPNDSAEDSFDILPVLLGEQSEKEPIRSFTLHETGTHELAIRKGQWKYLDHKGAGSSNYRRTDIWGMKDYALPEKYPDAPGQLYNLQDDPGETQNLYYDYPEIVRELKAQLDTFRKSGRSAPYREGK